MAVRFKISKGRKKTFMKLPISFLEYFLPRVNGDYLKIYMYGLKSCLENKSLSDSDIADKLNVLPADVTNAWRYWESEGVVFVDIDGSVEFINPDELQFNESEKQTKKICDNFEEIFKNVNEDEKFRKIIATIESIYPSLLTQNDILALYDIINVQGLSLELFLVTAAHCISMKKNRFNYIVKVLTETYKKGYTTPETMELYYASLTEAGQAYGRIKTTLKIYGRDLSDKEKEYIDSWLKEGKTEDDIKDAFEKTVINTGKLSFPYMNTILTKRNENKKSPVKAGPLNNFRQEMPDFQSIEDMLWEKQKEM